uniref:Reverse transcriptase domain-containing protein n=1 Tax=Arion vulgaris TaxID=1028688 RepID=A0A0B7AIM1_9EUPU
MKVIISPMLSFFTRSFVLRLGTWTSDNAHICLGLPPVLFNIQSTRLDWTLTFADEIIIDRTGSDRQEMIVDTQGTFHTT